MKLNNYEDDKIIKDLKDAPIEDALSSEEVFYYIGENIEKYENSNRGEIVFVSNYIYENGNVGKNHLFVILEKDKCSNIELYGMLISSQIHKQKYKYNFKIKRDKENNLKKDSIIKTDFIYKIKNKNIVKYIGKINENVLNKIEKMNKEYNDEKRKYK